MTRYKLFAPAKINLTLSITGRRADGYHTLHSDVAFADFGDEIIMDIEPSDAPSYTIHVAGRFADQAGDAAGNLALRAAQVFCTHYNLSYAITLYLTKNIPVGAGLGGGSSDAAAVLRGLTERTGLPVTTDMMLSLGADVPVCFYARPCIMEGVGDLLTPRPDPQPHNAVVLWPGPGPSTKVLYDAYAAHNQHTPPNDFLPVAMRFTPSIQTAFDALSSLRGCIKVGLSGSGTAVFGLFQDDAPTDKALNALNFPFVRRCTIGAANKPLVMPA